MNWEEIERRLTTLNWLVLLALGAASYVLMTADFTLGVIAGGLMGIANFQILKHTATRIFTQTEPSRPGKGIILLKYYFRLAITGIIIYILISGGGVSPIGLAVGLSTVIISITLLGLLILPTSHRNRVN